MNKIKFDKEVTKMGEAKRKKLYLKAVNYSKECAIPLELAIRRVQAFHACRKNYHKASKCPKCRRHDLVIDSTDYEYTSNESWVWCSNCGYTADITKRYEPLSSFYGFDIVGAMRADREKEFGDEWEAFVLKDTIEIEQEYGITKN